ncbi:MAG: hypothetical protein DRI86_00975 [Bacteroidetes bacterium]|nr:MAG: hypothetical protein DRI86_00975 [Bacteroidota bacterium]
MEEFLNKEKNIYAINWVLLGLSLIWFIASFFMDTATDNGTFVQRSGAILVLFGVITEYSLFQIDTTEKNNSVNIGNKPSETKRKMPKVYHTLKAFAHIYIVVGTFVWGYIDLLI